MLKTITIISDDDDWNSELPFKKYKEYRSHYEFFYELAEKQGIRFVRAHINWYKSNGIFEKAWSYDVKSKKWIKLDNVKADFVFDKAPALKKFKDLKYKINKEIGMMNNPEMDYKVNNKKSILKIFPNILPKTFIIKSNVDLKEKLQKINTEKAVLKPAVGSGGDKILIQDKSELINNNIKFDEDYILQEFIDTSKGIKGLVDCVHDLRVVLFNEKIAYSYIRIPKKGCLLCNIHQGGTMIGIRNDQIPEQVKKLLKIINKKLEKYVPRNYAADFFFDENQKAYLIEINTKPGLLFSSELGQELQIRSYNLLIKILKDSLD